jgi:cytochrome c peroxidase
MSHRRFACVVSVWLAGLAIAGVRADTPVPYVWQLPANFPRPRVPANNPMSDAKVELGRHLFYDTRLSGNGTQACATCHEQERAFTEGKGRAVGSTGQVHPRGSMSLVNVAYAAALTWGNPAMTRLEEQALVPMFGEQPVELGLQKPGSELLDRLRGFSLSAEQRDDLIAFLRSLTDEPLLHDRRFSNPWTTTSSVN